MSIEMSNSPRRGSKKLMSSSSMDNLDGSESLHRRHADTDDEPSSSNGVATTMNGANGDGSEQGHSHRENGGGGSHSTGEKLSTVMLATIVFYSVSGGPFGVEASVRAGGNFYTLLGFLIMPLVWSIPEAVMTAELGPTFPEAAGGVAWVEEAFGHGAGWMAGFLGWVAGATDNAIYPVLFLDYLLQLKGKSDDDNNDGASQNLHPVARFLILAATSILLAYINWLGLPVVGKMSLAICFLAMSPFIILSIVGAFSVDSSRWFQRPIEDLLVIEAVTDDDIDGGFFPYAVAAGVMWRPFLNSLFWNLNSFDSAASFAEDVDDPGRTFPVALKWSVVMVVMGYFIPLLVALGASDAPQHEWVDGYFEKVATDVVGPWLGVWTVFAAGISNIALFQAELSTESFQLMGMAERGYVPKIFGERSRHGTPTYGIVLGTAVIVALSCSDLAQLIEMLNFNYAISLLMEYGAFIKLRISRPELHRPWRLPLNTLGCILFFIPTFAFTLALMALATYTTYAFSIAVNTVGLVMYTAKKQGFWGEGPVGGKGTYNLVHIDSVVAETAASDSDDGEQINTKQDDHIIT